jgi:carbonic anhydrase
VLGHAGCGGIRAFATREPPLSPGDFIGRWMSLIAPAAAALGPPEDQPSADYLTRLEEASILNSLTNLMSFPFVREPVEQGRLHLHAAYFDVATGALAISGPAGPSPAGDPAFGRFAAVAAT